MTVIRKLGDQAMLPPGDHLMSFAEIRGSDLILGPPHRAAWDRAWRSVLLANLEILAQQLWQVGITEIFVGGSFVEAKDRPNDIDGYFVCDRAAYKSRTLHQALNALDPRHPWTWRQEHRTPNARGALKLPLYHHYHVELLPYYGQTRTGLRDRTGADIDVPTLYRATRGTRHPRGIIRLKPPAAEPNSGGASPAPSGA